jgi:hypothetical protein
MLGYQQSYEAQFALTCQLLVEIEALKARIKELEK